MPDTPQASSRRLLAALGGLVVLLTVAGAVSFFYYAREHAPNPRLVAVAPFDIFVPGGGLDAWRVGLAQRLTDRLTGTPPLEAVPQAIVAQTWRSAPRGEIAAVELARRTGAGLAIYGRVDAIEGRTDSVRASLIAVDALSSRVLFGVLLRWPAADPDVLADHLAEHVRHNLRTTAPPRASSDTPPDPAR